MPNTIVPAIPITDENHADPRERHRRGTRAGLSERQSAAIMIENATSAATSANADRRWSARIQSLSATGT